MISGFTLINMCTSSSPLVNIGQIISAISLLTPIFLIIILILRIIIKNIGVKVTQHYYWPRTCRCTSMCTPLAADRIGDNPQKLRFWGISTILACARRCVQVYVILIYNYFATLIMIYQHHPHLHTPPCTHLRSKWPTSNKTLGFLLRTGSVAPWVLAQKP